MNTPLTLHFDGLCEPNPGGTACWSWVAYADGQRCAEDCGCLGHGPGMTNNVAEYRGAIEALTWAREHADGTSIELRGDSLLVINQATGQWRCNAEHLRPLRDRVVELVQRTGARLSWVPREQNAEADVLCWKAYREARGGQAGASPSPPGQRLPAPVARAQVKLSVDPVTIFHALSRWAQVQGLLTEKQAQAIARAKTRKQGYWNRHLLDLCAVITSCSGRSTLPREDQNLER